MANPKIQIMEIQTETPNAVETKRNRTRNQELWDGSRKFYSMTQ